MRGRSRAGSAKSRRRKPAARKAGSGIKLARPVSSSAAGLESEIARLAHDLNDALERETAASEVLKTISSAQAASLQPVLDTVVLNAAQLCRALNATIYLREDDSVVIRAQHGPPGLSPIGTRRPLNRDWVAGASVLDARPIQVADLLNSKEYPAGRESARRLGHRTTLAVPLLRDKTAIGVIVATRREVHPFSRTQITLVQNFAAQAVIAIENARLLNELRESLDRQTATADILRVIAGTPEDSKRALDTIAETASRMFDAANINFRRLEGNVLRIVSSAGPTVAKLRKALPDIPLEQSDPAVRAVLDNKQIPVDDRLASLKNEHGDIARALRELDIRSQVFTPLSREGKSIGVMIVSRSEVRPFQEHELELMRGFADQAVIAIENARLLSELRESLEQQTATADVLRVISSSPGELEPVFHAVLENATRICEAVYGNLLLRENGAFRRAAQCNAPQELIEEFQRNPVFVPLPNNPLDQVLRTKETVHTVDAQAESNLGLLANARTLLNVPMLSHDELIGVISIYRQEVRPFTDKQIDLVKNFAAQAIIAIENARLLSELRDSYRMVQQQAGKLEVQSRELATLNQKLEQRVADQVGEIERMSRLRRFLPPQVADLIVASGTEKQLESHRREITALFCDLRGFTGFSESSDPEDVMALLAEYHAAIGTIINKYSGTLERYAGDGVMVIFNDPVPVENPALQAVLMALEMRTAIEALMEKWRLLGHDIGFGIGIAHGFATLGTIGFEGRRDYAAIGTVSNVASRLCDEAKLSQILISPRVALAVNKAVSLEPAGEFALKGIRRPMMAYNVLEASLSKPN